jgi:class 3 adenylate cyclase/CHASE2 domain-containing sensor protein
MQFKKNLKHICIISLIVLVSIFSLMRLLGASFSTPITHFFVYRENIEPLNWLYRYAFKPSSDIAIIKIDDATLNTLQANSDLKMLTISKWVYGELIDKLQSVWVKWIAFDIVFQNKDPEEKEFAEKLSKYPNIVLATTSTTTDVCYKDQDSDITTCDGVPRSIYKDISWGNINTNIFRDRKIATTDIGKSEYTSWKKSLEIDTLSLALYKTSLDIAPVSFSLGQSVLVPFFGKPGSYPSISLSSVPSMSKVDLISNFAGKYVFIWESGWFIHDAFVSPVDGELMDGVESHAHFLDGILQWRSLSWYSLLDGIFIFAVILLIFLMVTIYIVSVKYISAIIAFAIIAWIVWMSRYAYFSHAIVLEIFPLLLAGSIFTFPLTFIYRFFIVDREKRMIKNAFAHYVDPEIVRLISDNAEKINLWGESRELSILFSDIAGFTTLSEKMPVNELFFLMSSYLSSMTGILTQNGWTLDKYIGDAVMGFFWAPLSQADHARRACQTALDMREALPAFNNELLSRWLEAIDFRVGIATGDVLVGNIGSHDRFNYTVLWDSVNLASRLEATSKEYGTHIIVSEKTYILASDYFSFRKLDTITVKGKNESVGIYELIANISDRTLDMTKYENYARALSLYMKWEYLRAGQIWEMQIESDPPSRVMAHRCLDILRGEVAVEGWVYHMTKK